MSRVITDLHLQRVKCLLLRVVFLGVDVQLKGQRWCARRRRYANLLVKRIGVSAPVTIEPGLPCASMRVLSAGIGDDLGSSYPGLLAALKSRIRDKRSRRTWGR